MPSKDSSEVIDYLSRSLIIAFPAWLLHLAFSSSKTQVYPNPAPLHLARHFRSCTTYASLVRLAFPETNWKCNVHSVPFILYPPPSVMQRSASYHAVCKKVGCSSRHGANFFPVGVFRAWRADYQVSGCGRAGLHLVRIASRLFERLISFVVISPCTLRPPFSCVRTFN